MLIQEILLRKKYLDHKVRDLDNYLDKLSKLDLPDKASYYNKAIDLKFSLLTKIRSHKVLLEDKGKETLVTIGGKELSIYEAVQIRDTIREQIDTLNRIISKGDLSVVNIFGLMNQRDNLFEELILLENAIRSSDANTEWLIED